jgi:hypothetical protein
VSIYRDGRCTSFIGTIYRSHRKGRDMERELGRDIDRTDVRRGEAHAAETVAAGSLTEAIGGIGAIVLGILGLAGIVPQTLAAIGVIVVGSALMAEGTAILSKYSKLAASSGTDESWTGSTELGGGVSLEFIGGIGVVVLGILALLSIAPITLMAIGVIAYGAALVLSAGTMSRLNSMEALRYNTSESHQTLARDAVMGTTAIQMLTGVGGVVLGILALVGVNPLTLILVSLLGFGSAILLSGSALTGRMLSAVRG